MLRRALSDPLTRLGGLGALLAVSVTLLHLPAAIYGGNADEFDFALAIYLLLGLPLVLVLTAATVLSLVRLPPSARAVAAGIACGVGLLAWIYGNFFLGDTVLLDGRHAALDFSTPLGALEPVAALAAIAATAAVAVRYARSAIFFLLALNLGLAAVTLSEALRDPHLANPLHREDTAELFRFSRQGNVLLVLLDTLQADVFDRVVRADGALAAGLDGFTLYRDAVGIAPTTLLSIPAIHSGQAYSPRESIRRYYEQGVREHSFLNELAAVGFETTLLNPVKNVCPRRAALCTSTAQALDERGEELRDDALLLLDLSLFRIVPFSVKAFIYRSNKWLFSRLTTAHFFSDFILQGNDLIALLAHRLAAGDGPRTAKFVHLFTTHPPYILAADCASILPNDVGNVDNQARCSLHALLTLFDAMKRGGVYDATAIALIADHGYALPSSYPSADDSGSDRWSTLVGAANPTFALKPPRANGGLSFGSGA